MKCFSKSESRHSKEAERILNTNVLIFRFLFVIFRNERYLLVLRILYHQLKGRFSQGRGRNLVRMIRNHNGLFPSSGAAGEFLFLQIKYLLFFSLSDIPMACAHALKL